MCTRPPVAIVSDALGEVVSLVRPQRALRNVAVVVDVRDDTPTAQIAHSDLVQVLLNLMLNAADAVPKASGKILVEAGPCQSAHLGEHVRIAISDNGPGIAPAIEGCSVEPFVTTKAVGDGTGLGLAVCRGLVDGAGGTISVEPSRLGGACFVIRLRGGVPRRLGLEHAATETGPPERRPSGGPASVPADHPFSARPTREGPVRLVP